MQLQPPLECTNIYSALSNPPCRHLAALSHILPSAKEITAEEWASLSETNFSALVFQTDKDLDRQHGGNKTLVQNLWSLCVENISVNNLSDPCRFGETISVETVILSDTKSFSWNKWNVLTAVWNHLHLSLEVRGTRISFFTKGR